MTTIVHTVDIALLDPDGRILLIERGKEPYRGELVLPGGHVEASDVMRAASECPRSAAHSPHEIMEIALRIAAVRELHEECGVTLAPGALRSCMTLDRPGRDPRGAYVSHVFRALVPPSVITAARAGSDAARIVTPMLYDVNARDMGFDHGDVIRSLRAWDLGPD